MFRFFTRRSGRSFDFSQLGSDMHSHLLPGIDDGARDMEMALRLAKGMEDLGYRRLVTTPHIMWDMYRNTAEIIDRGKVQLQKELAERGSALQLEAAAEYFMDDHFSAEVASALPLLTFGKKMVLVEFSLAQPSFNIKEILFSLQMQSYIPVIAHPERYIYLDRERDLYDDLKAAGCLFQLNILSLSGAYGRTPADLANYLIRKDYYDLAGTDLHHERHLEALRQSQFAAPLQRLVDSGRLRNGEI